MLASFFSVLGIIGKVLLIILAIVLVLLIFVFVAPLHYKFVMKYNSSQKCNEIGTLRFSWLLHILRAKVFLNLDGIEYEIRLFGVKTKLFDRFINKIADDSDEKDDDDYTYNSLADIEQLQNSKRDNEFSNEDEFMNDIEEIWEDIVSEVELDDGIKDVNNTKKIKFTWKKLFRTNPFKLIYNYINMFIDMIKKLISAIISTIDLLLKKYEMILEFWELKSTQASVERILNYIARLCTHIKPKKTRMDLTFGFEDPAMTGQVLGAVGIVYGFVGESLRVTPDFEEEMLDVRFLTKGRVRVINLSIIGIRLYKDKAVKRLIKNINRLKEDLANVR